MVTVRYLLWRASAVALLSLGAAAAAKDLGRVGPVYAIGEPDMLNDLRAQLEEKKKTGELEKVMREAKARTIAQIEQPSPVAGIQTARVARSFHYDPTVRFDEPVVDNDARTIIAAGTVANPFAATRYNSTLLFFDGRDPKQVQFAKALADAGGLNLRPILVAGSPIQIMRAWRRPVFFDQGGVIVKRLGIHAVPARVRQDGAKVLIEELPAP